MVLVTNIKAEWWAISVRYEYDWNEMNTFSERRCKKHWEGWGWFCDDVCWIFANMFPKNKAMF